MLSPIEMGTMCGGMPASPSQWRSGVLIGIGDAWMSLLRMFFGYWSITETEAEEMEELEWGGSEYVVSDRGEGQVSGGEE